MLAAVARRSRRDAVRDRARRARRSLGARASAPRPDAGRDARAQSRGRAQIALTDDDRARLDERFPASSGDAARASGRASPCHGAATDGEIVLVMGLPGAGKSTRGAGARRRRLHPRLNRDEAGGSLSALLPRLDRADRRTAPPRIVLDNTYVSRKSRGARDPGGARGAGCRCAASGSRPASRTHRSTPSSRIVSRYGRLLGPEELQQRGEATTSARSARRCSSATSASSSRRIPSEGFSRIDVVPFERAARPVAGQPRGDRLVRRRARAQPLRAADAALAGRRRRVRRNAARVLRRYADDGWQAARPVVAAGDRRADDDARREADAVFARLRELLGVAIEVEYCPHARRAAGLLVPQAAAGAGRGLPAAASPRSREVPYVGAGAQDPGFARRLGFQYRDASGFFGVDQ